MNLIKFTKNDNYLPNLRTVMDDFFGDNFFKEMSTGSTLPAVNISNTDKEITLELAVPGYNKNDLNIHLEDNILTISSEKKNQIEEKDTHYSRKEYSYTSFSRSFTLPENIDKDGIEAECKDGVLKLSISKKELPQKSQKKIEIK